jgi:FO synthase
MRAIIRSLGREPQQRDTLYRAVSAEREAAAEIAEPLTAVVQTSPHDPQALSRVAV